jgi:tetratricopeptide (TPR) repeat protein
VVPRAAQLLVALGWLGCAPRVPPAPAVRPPIGDPGLPPPTARARVAQGWVALQQGRLDDAASLGQAAHNLDPHHGEPRRLLAAVARDGGHPDAALDFLAQAVAVDPDCAACWLDLGVAKMGHDDAGALVALRASTAGGGDARGWSLAILVARRLGEEVVATALLNTWSQQPDLDPRGLLLRGITGHAMGQDEAALDDVRTAVLHMPADHFVLDTLVVVAWAARRPGVALDTLRELARVRSGEHDVVMAWWNLAQATDHAADVQAAGEAWAALPSGRGGSNGRWVAEQGVQALTLHDRAVALSWLARSAPPRVRARVVDELAAVSSELPANELMNWAAAAQASGRRTAAKRAVLAASEERADAALDRWTVEYLLSVRDPVSAGRVVARDLTDAKGWPAWWPDALQDAGYGDRGQALLESGLAGEGDGLARVADALCRSGDLRAEAALGPDPASALSLDPALALCMANLRGDTGGAVDALVTLADRSEGLPSGVGSAGYAWAVRGDRPALAASVLRRLHERLPGDGLVAHGLGLVLLELGDVDGALVALAEARRLLPSNEALTLDRSRAAAAAWTRTSPPSALER